MNKKNHAHRVLCLLFAVLCGGALTAAAASLPDAKFTIPAPDPKAQAYLGLKSAVPFTLPQTGARLVILEFMSAMCPQCHSNAPVVNKIYNIVGSDPALKDVKVIGIAVSSDKAQLDAYRKAFKVPFPMFIDGDFSISASMGGIETPTTLIVAANSGKVLAVHGGVIRDVDGFLKEIRAFHEKSAK